MRQQRGTCLHCCVNNFIHCVHQNVFLIFFLRYTYHDMAMVKFLEFFQLFSYFSELNKFSVKLQKNICRGGPTPHPPLQINFQGRVGAGPPLKIHLQGRVGSRPTPTNLFHNSPKNSFNSNRAAKQFKKMCNLHHQQFMTYRTGE